MLDIRGCAGKELEICVRTPWSLLINVCKCRARLHTAKQRKITRRGMTARIWGHKVPKSWAADLEY
jgi:hypothetical protein